MRVHQMLQAKGFWNMDSGIRITKYFFQECDHEKKLFIILLPHISLDRNAVIHLIGERYDWIIDYNYIFYISISNNSQIFDVDSVIRIYAMLSVKTMLYYLSLGIKVVQASICVVLCSCGEHTNLVILG